MARWIVMRHADAAPQGPDLERELTPMGRADARAMGDWLRETGWVPQRVLTSPAMRCRQTVDQVLAAAGGDARPESLDPLYRGGPRAYISALRRSTVDTTLLVGHLPAVDEVVLALAEDAERNGAGKLMTTAAAACFEDGRLMALQRPDELTTLHELGNKA